MADTTKKTKTEAQIKAHKKYMQRFCEIKVRMTPAEREQVKKHAESVGMSTSSFIKKAISNISDIKFDKEE